MNVSPEFKSPIVTVVEVAFTLIPSPSVSVIALTEPYLVVLTCSPFVNVTVPVVNVEVVPSFSSVKVVAALYFSPLIVAVPVGTLIFAAKSTVAEVFAGNLIVVMISEAELVPVSV